MLVVHSYRERVQIYLHISNNIFEEGGAVLKSPVGWIWGGWGGGAPPTDVRGAVRRPEHLVYKYICVYIYVYINYKISIRLLGRGRSHFPCSVILTAVL